MFVKMVDLKHIAVFFTAKLITILCVLHHGKVGLKHFAFPSKFTLQLMTGTVSAFLGTAWVSLLFLPSRRSEILSLPGFLQHSEAQFLPALEGSVKDRDQGTVKNGISHPRK